MKERIGTIGKQLDRSTRWLEQSTFLINWVEESSLIKTNTYLLINLHMVKVWQ